MCGVTGGGSGNAGMKEDKSEVGELGLVVKLCYVGGECGYVG